MLGFSHPVQLPDTHGAGTRPAISRTKHGAVPRSTDIQPNHLVDTDSWPEETRLAHDPVLLVSNIEDSHVNRKDQFVGNLEILETREVFNATNLTAVTVSQSEVNLIWSLTNTTDTSVVIERANGTSTSYQTLATLPGNDNTYTDVSGWANTTYSYEVYTIAANGTDTTPTAAVTATTDPVQSGALNVVTNLKVVANTPTTDTVTFTNTNSGVSDLMYLVERSSNGITYQVVGSIESATTFSDVGLTPGATYEYRVRAGRNGDPDSNYSALVSLTMPVPAAALPKTPSALTATDLSATSVQVSWTNNDPNNPQFQVYRAAYSGSGQSFSLVATTAAGATSFTDTGLTADQPYEYRVRAINGAVAPRTSPPRPAT